MESESANTLLIVNICFFFDFKSPKAIEEFPIRTLHVYTNTSEWSVPLENMISPHTLTQKGK